MELSQRHQVSIIIVTYNSLPALQDSLSSLKRAVEDIDFELTVVDNGSVDGSLECVRRHFNEAVVITNDRNIGFSAACNMGAKAASGEYLLFHNPDLQLDREAIRNMLAAMGQVAKPGALAGRMRYPDGSFQATCRNFPTIGNLLFSRGSVLSRFSGKQGTYTLGDFDDTTDVPAVAGTLMMIRRDLFISQNGFDERFFMYMEDTDLCLRLHREGYKNYFVPAAGGVHLWGKGSRGGHLIRRYYHHRSVWKYFLKHFPNPVSYVILPVVLGVNMVLAALWPGPTKRS